MQKGLLNALLGGSISIFFSTEFFFDPNPKSPERIFFFKFKFFEAEKLH